MSAKPTSLKLISSCTIGTFLEFFDYTLYGYFASIISHLFFPYENLTLRLIATWGIFSIGFLVRPIGAMVFGHIADRKGRNKVLPVTTILMAFPTVIIGCLPTFATIGWLAPTLLLLCRLVQGLAISAEYNGASIYILENYWRRPGLLGALTPFSCGMGMLAASFLAYLFTHNNNGELSEWQWRTPFIIAGSLVGLVAWYLRRNLQETDGFQQLQTENNILQKPLTHLFKNNKFALTTNIVCSAYMCTASYLLLVYLANFLNQQFHVPLTMALLFTSLAALVESNCTLLFGWVSDWFGRWQTMLVAAITMAALAFLLTMQPNLSVYQLMVYIILMVVLLAAFDGPLTIYLPSLYETNIRYSATAVGYNIGGAAMGGLAPFAVSMILQYVRSPQFVLGIYLGSFAVISSLIILINVMCTKKDLVIGDQEYAVTQK